MATFNDQIAIKFLGISTCINQQIIEWHADNNGRKHSIHQFINDKYEQIELIGSSKNTDEFFLSTSKINKYDQLRPLIKKENNSYELIKGTETFSLSQTLIFHEKLIKLKKDSNYKTEDDAIQDAIKAAKNRTEKKNFNQNYGLHKIKIKELKEKAYSTSSQAFPKSLRYTAFKMMKIKDQDNLKLFYTLLDQFGKIINKTRVDIDIDDTFETSGKRYKIFEALQQCRHFSDKFFSNNGNAITFRVGLKIGGCKRYFFMVPSENCPSYENTKRQITICLPQSDSTNEPNIYPSRYINIIEKLIPDNFKDDEKFNMKMAQLLYDASTQQPSEQIDWEKIDFDLDQNSALELLLITQIAEAAPPTIEYFNYMLSAHYNSPPPSGRMPGADYWARALFKKIIKEKTTFYEAFGKYDMYYKIANKTENAREIFKKNGSTKLDENDSSSDFSDYDDY